MNLIEVACSVKPTSASAEDDASTTLLGVTFLNKHCLVVDLAGSSQAAEQEPLLKRTFELKVQILQDMLGWQLLAWAAGALGPRDWPREIALAMDWGCSN